MVSDFFKARKAVADEGVFVGGWSLMDAVRAKKVDGKLGE